MIKDPINYPINFENRIINFESSCSKNVLQLAALLYEIIK